jgi:hypothetical protein
MKFAGKCGVGCVDKKKKKKNSLHDSVSTANGVYRGQGSSSQPSQSPPPRARPAGGIGSPNSGAACVAVNREEHEGFAQLYFRHWEPSNLTKKKKKKKKHS